MTTLALNLTRSDIAISGAEKAVDVCRARENLHEEMLNKFIFDAVVRKLTLQPGGHQ